MRIAFYAPLKSPHHTVPSGDRQMARLLVAALRQAGHSVEVASELRSFSAKSSQAMRDPISATALEEVERLRAAWRAGETPDLWFCYHPYYKAPDLIGPSLAAEFDIPYVTAEASYSERRNESGWAELQGLVVDAIRQAALNICFTERDETGLRACMAGARLARLSPFIDTSAFQAEPATDDAHRLVTVAMMRPGDKLESYRLLAKALAMLEDLPWSLTVIGDGPMRGEVQALFAEFAKDRIAWLGEKRGEEIVEILYRGGVYIWPGVGEAYGIAYLEAQAAGLPVVAQAIAGVPEVTRDGVTGILTPIGDMSAFAEAIARICRDNQQRIRLGRAARRFVLEERSLEIASKRLDLLLREHTGQAA